MYAHGVINTLHSIHARSKQVVDSIEYTGTIITLFNPNRSDRFPLGTGRKLSGTVTA